MRAKSPCYQCKDRADGCHGRCESYLQYKRDIGSYTEDIKEARDHFRVPRTDNDLKRWNNYIKRSK